MKFVNLFILTYLYQVFYCSWFSLAFEFNSKLDKYEIENFKYQIDIDQLIKPESSIQSDSNLIPMRSSNGQKYSCSLNENLMNYKDDDNFENLEENVLFKFFTTQTPSLESNKPIGQNNLSFNFTLIDNKIKDFMDELNNSNICIYKNNGWWTYEYCFGKFISQYHILANGSIQGEKIILGNFSRDYDWTNANESNKLPILNDIFYHEQYYDMGSLCELTNKPRRATVKILCDETSLNQIEIINEIETCVYEIYIKSYSICSIPNFSKKSNIYNINCSPIVTDDVYEKYLAKTNEQKIKNQEAEIISDIEKLQKINEEFKAEFDESEKELENIIENTESLKNIDDAQKIEDELTKNDELFDKITNKLNSILDDFESNQVNDELLNTNDEPKVSVLAESSDLLKDIDNLDVGELEKKLVEKLSKSDRLSSSLKNNKIKIKIIKVDSNNVFGTNSFNSLLSNLFESGKDKEKINQMNKNYNQVYNENSINNLSNQSDMEYVEDGFYTNENDQENLIVF